MNLRNFFAELKRRNIYKVAKPCLLLGGWSRSLLFEIALVLVRLDHVTSFIVNANHSMMRERE
jgi:hypothetical protein